MEKSAQILDSFVSDFMVELIGDNRELFTKSEIKLMIEKVKERQAKI